MKERSFEPIKGRQTEKSKDEGFISPRHRPEKVASDLELQNIEAKERMAEELMDMGLSREAVERILKLDLGAKSQEKSAARGRKKGACRKQGIE